MTQNLAVHYKRHLCIVEASPIALKLRRKTVLLSASLAERATPEEVDAEITATTTPTQSLPEVPSANKYLGSVLERIKRDGWQDQMEREWRRSRP